MQQMIFLPLLNKSVPSSDSEGYSPGEEQLKTENLNLQYVYNYRI